MEKYDYYSVDDFLNDFDKNVNELSGLLAAWAKIYVSRYKLSLDADEVVNMFFEKVISGKRRVPRDLPLNVSLHNILKSICDSVSKCKEERFYQQSEPLDWYENELVSMDDDKRDRFFDQLMTLFYGDDNATKFLEAIGDGKNKSEISNSVFQGDEKAYDTTRRRIVRNGQKLLKLQEVE